MMRFEQLNLNDRGNVPVGTEYHTSSTRLPAAPISFTRIYPTLTVQLVTAVSIKQGFKKEASKGC